jgi:hypothetical protein
LPLPQHLLNFYYALQNEFRNAVMRFIIRLPKNVN